MQTATEDATRDTNDDGTGGHVAEGTEADR